MQDEERRLEIKAAIFDLDSMKIKMAGMLRQLKIMKETSSQLPDSSQTMSKILENERRIRQVEMEIFNFERKVNSMKKRYEENTGEKY